MQNTLTHAERGALSKLIADRGDAGAARVLDVSRGVPSSVLAGRARRGSVELVRRGLKAAGEDDIMILRIRAGGRSELRGRRRGKED